MLRSFLLYLSNARWTRRAITGFAFARRAAGRFIAGETADDAVRAVRELNASGITATVDYLGENALAEADAVRAASAYLTVLERMAAAGARSHASLKLTQIGLDLSEGLCVDNLRRIAKRARAWETFVRVDMEGSDYTERTLNIVRTLKHEQGFDNVGVVIQAYLYRSQHDIAELIGEGVRVRLCKGAYREPPDRAYPRKRDVDANFMRLARMLLDAAAKSTDGPYPAFATHDQRLIAAVKAYAAQQGAPGAAYEFQMLYGIRRDLQRSLVREGHNVRVYVPYGGEWYPYFMRRLAERPANLWFFLSNLIRR